MNAKSSQAPQKNNPLLALLLRPTRSQRKKMLRVEAWIFVIASYAVIIFAYLWAPDYRNQGPAYVAVSWAAFMVRTFIFHVGLVLTVIALLAACVRTWKLLVAVVPLLCLTVGPVIWQCRPRTAPTIAGESLTVMSVNLLMINENTQPIIDEIKAAGPDLLFLQEYTPAWHDVLQEAIGPRYPHVSFVPRDDSFGAAVYSRRPFVGDVTVFLRLAGGTEPQMRAVIELAGRRVAVYNIHLLPPWGLEYTTENRLQFADLLDKLAGERLPVILAGDFNFTETSPNAASLRGIGLRDAHDLGGWGRGTTWPVNSFFRWIPSLRLDHIYLSDELTCSRCRTGVGTGSDHRPVVAEIGFR